jgi:hypothetical protein
MVAAARRGGNLRSKYGAQSQGTNTKKHNRLTWTRLQRINHCSRAGGLHNPAHQGVQEVQPAGL